MNRSSVLFVAALYWNWNILSYWNIVSCPVNLLLGRKDLTPLVFLVGQVLQHFGHHISDKKIDKTSLSVCPPCCIIIKYHEPKLEVYGKNTQNIQRRALIQYNCIKYKVYTSKDQWVCP